MLVAHVHIKVKADCVKAFTQATLENAEQSILEAGIERFELIQSVDDETSFVLVEAYRTGKAQLLHKETSHFQKWVEAVNEMMDSQRYALMYSTVNSADQPSN